MTSGGDYRNGAGFLARAVVFNSVVSFPRHSVLISAWFRENNLSKLFSLAFYNLLSHVRRHLFIARKFHGK